MSKHETPQNGATPKPFNFYPRPMEPMLVEAIRMTGRRPETKEDRLLQQLIARRAKSAGDHGLILFVLWELNQVETPADLEAFYRALRPYVADVPKYAALIDNIYAEMWQHFTGGHS